MIDFDFDPATDLKLERVIDVPPALVWKAWTEPQHLMRWFCPRPWQTVECEIDLQPGGRFYTVMQGPEGQTVPGMGCYLEVVPETRLVWTERLHPGYRPAPVEPGALGMTAAVLLEPTNGGTRYTALAFHADPESREKHHAMGFEQGWSTALDQLIEVAKTF